MNRNVAALVLFAGLFSACTPAFAQFQVLQPPSGTPTVIVGEQFAETTRERLRELLRQHPPAVREILRHDPSLANAEYLAPYPALVAFLQQHPEIARDPSYFFGSFDYRPQPP